MRFLENIFGKKYKCLVPGCNYSSDNQHALGGHTKQMHAVFRCGPCKLLFTGAVWLEEHRRNFHAKNK